MSLSTQGTTTRGVSRADEYEFTGNEVVEGIYASNGGVLDVTGTSGVKLPTATPAAGDILYATDAAGTLAYKFGGDAGSVEMALAGVFRVKGSVAGEEQVLGSVSLDETLLSPGGGNVNYGVSLSHKNLSSASFAVTLRRLTGSYADDAALVSGGTALEIVSIAAGPSGVFTVTNAFDAVTTVAASASAVYAVTVTTPVESSPSDVLELRDITVHVNRAA